jgi:hypothetical protein
MTISVEDISQSAETYFKKLDAFVAEHRLTKRDPSTIAWKVTDIDEFNDTLSGFLKSELVIQCHIGFVDKRYIASVVFKQPIYRNVSILKLMQRRPGSTDPVGLDHADFPVNNLSSLENELKAKKVVKWSHESNEVHGWISVWFDGTEAKFVDHIVLDVGVKELQNITKRLGFDPKAVDDIQQSR